MSQAEVLALLKRKKKWMTTKEINKALGIASASANLSKLLKYGEVRQRFGKTKVLSYRTVEWAAI